MKITFALYFANRGFFPGELIADARSEMIQAVEAAGFDYICMDETLTRYGAVETIKEGAMYAQFLEEHKGEYDGIIMCLPNFGDENGASEALKDVNVPVLVQAYPDEIDRMDFAHRRDALCGKIAMCNVLRQLKIPYTLTTKTCESPLSKEFAEDLRLFAGTCRAVKGMRKFNIGAIGARTTAFKTVRCDEIAMANHRVNVETIDLSYVFKKMESVDEEKKAEKKALYTRLSDFGAWPEEKLENIACLGVVIDEIIEEFDLHAVAVRCWDELEKTFGVAPCLILGELNQRGIAAACEVDINNAVMMRALNLAADYPVMLLDVNNNFMDADDKCIFFHCGPVPEALLEGPGTIEEHLMFKKSFGAGAGVGVNKAKIIRGEATVGSLKTEDGAMCAFVTEGKLTDDYVGDGFFGCGIVFKKDNIEEMLHYMCEKGYRHHVAITKGNWAKAVTEAFDKYLHYQIDRI